MTPKTFAQVLTAMLMGFCSPLAQADTIIKTFASPTVKGAPMDQCYSPGKGCGGHAAAKFCASKGYEGAKSWSVKQTKMTRYIGAGGMCGNLTGSVAGGAIQCMALVNVKCHKTGFRAEPGLGAGLPN
jgi:hypothetical protein